MTKKDYELIARVLKGLNNGEDNPEVSFTLVVEEFANVLSAENDRFDFDKFVKACGLVATIPPVNYHL